MTSVELDASRTRDVNGTLRWRSIFRGQACPPEPPRSRHAAHEPPYTRSSLVRWITRENPGMREWGNEGVGNEERPLSSRASADSERANRVEESSSAGVEGSALGFRAENADNCQRTLRTAQAKE